MKYEDNFKKFKREYDEALVESMEEIGIFATAEAQLRTPVKTGNLRRSIGYDTNKVDEVTIGTNVGYAEIVHNGSSKRRSQPFILDAIYQNLTNIEDIFKSFLSKVGD